jgi:hypothetical protein
MPPRFAIAFVVFLVVRVRGAFVPHPQPRRNLYFNARAIVPEASATTLDSRQSPFPKSSRQISPSDFSGFRPNQLSEADQSTRIYRDYSGFESRRTAVASIAGSLASSCLAWNHNFGTSFAYAAASVSTSLSGDVQKLQDGLNGLNYLLDHWEEETKVCITSNDNPYLTDGTCERSPLKVMEYLGYKSTSHPLFKGDKMLQRLEPLIASSNDSMSRYLDSMEQFQQAADEASGMAYVSSWGESNPGGGRDRVAYFLQRSKQCVVTARNALQAIADIIEVGASR